MNLFMQGLFSFSSGKKGNFKIECDALTDDDWKSLADIIAADCNFCDVLGVPRGGVKLEKYLKIYSQYDNKLPFLIVDDVYNTGKAIREFQKNLKGVSEVIGYVVFARDTIKESWVKALFQMNVRL